MPVRKHLSLSKYLILKRTMKNILSDEQYLQVGQFVVQYTKKAKIITSRRRQSIQMSF